MILFLLAVAFDAPLADAAERGDWVRVEALLKEGADVKAAQVDGMTALHWAVHHDNADVVRRLIAAGADVRAANRYSVSPLSTACVNGTEAVVVALLEAGADPNEGSVLTTAARTGRVGPVKALLDRGAKVESVALHRAAAEGHAAVVELLLKAGADAKARLPSGFTALHFASRDGRLEVVRVLLKAGADASDAIPIDKRGRGMPLKGTSALILAVENGHFDLAMALVEAGADPNDQRSGHAPLHVLAWVRKANRGDDEDGQPAPRGSGALTSLEFAKALVKRGADPNLALERGDSGAGRLSMRGATPLLLAAKRADLPYIKLLVELGADPLRANEEGATPLMAAAGIGTLAPTEEAGSEDEALETASYLLAAGADVNAVDKKGETAMHGAAYKSLPKMVQFLADRGAKIETWNRKNKHGWTPVLIAEGFRPGNFKPSVDTLAALHKVMRAAGVEPPPPTPRPEPGKKPETYKP